MIATLTTDTLQRIETERRETVERLARQAAHLEVTRDTMTAGWIVRNPKIPGCVEIVTEDGRCSCHRFQLWDRCKHAARVEVLYGEMRTQ